MKSRLRNWRDTDPDRKSDSDLHDEADCVADFTSAASILDHAVVLTRTAINRPAALQVRWPLSPLARTMRRDLPYALRPVPGRPDWHILVNRNYKPCGSIMNRMVWAIYEDWPSHHLYLPNGMEPSERLSCWALFNDGTVPWFSKQNATAYLERLLQLREAQRSASRSRN